MGAGALVLTMGGHLPLGRPRLSSPHVHKGQSQEVPDTPASAVVLVTGC